MLTAGVLCLVGFCVALTDAASIGLINTKVKEGCDSQIYCTGPLLETVQLAEIFNDSKTFVDLPQTHDPTVTLANFKALMEATNNKPNRTQVQEFVYKNFQMEDELYNWTLSDWKKDPAFIKRIEDPNYREWLKRLNEIWKILARKMKEDVAEHPERHSLIYVDNPFVVPGGRFKEFYYWDSYWICLGLLQCEMHETVKGMIRNFKQMVDTYGFIPNGGRVYYLMRSQPPMLVLMVAAYLEHTGDVEFLREMLPVLEREFSYYQQYKMVDVVKDGKTYRMGHYVVKDEQPRPESYKEDYQLAQQLDSSKRGNFYNEIKAGAESGWDFSNRWCIGDQINNTLSLLNISTSSIIPVDLNALLQRNTRFLSGWYNLLGNSAKALHYKKIAKKLQSAIDNVLWNEEEGTWLDYDMKNKQPRRNFYPSNLTPLYTNSYDPWKTATIARRSLDYLKRQKIDEFPGGTPTSLNHTGEQWDFPNAWPPLQSFLVKGLWNTGVKDAIQYAESLASRWIRSNYLGFHETGKMYEKYDATVPGQGGGGGEYTVQEGFGWTNGVIFEFFQMFPRMSLDMNSDFTSSHAYTVEHPVEVEV